MNGRRESNRPRRLRRAEINRAKGTYGPNQRCPRCKKLRKRWLRANNWDEGRTRWGKAPDGRRICWICVKQAGQSTA